MCSYQFYLIYILFPPWFWSYSLHFFDVYFAIGSGELVQFGAHLLHQLCYSLLCTANLDAVVRQRDVVEVPVL